MIKKDLLRRKIQEYFTKYPKSKSVIIKTDIGHAKTLWKVVREGKKFNVTEVNTNKNEFVFESGINVVQEASVEFSNLSKAFVTAMTPPFDHTRLSNALKTANQAIVKITDPKEKDQVGSMIGALTMLVDNTTAGGGSSITNRSSVSAGLQTSGRKIQGKLVREADKKDDEEEKKSPKKEPEKTATQKLDPTKEPEVSDIETNGNQQSDVDEPVPERKPSSEELAVAKNLTGQTIKNAHVTIKPDGGELTLDLISAAAPSVLKWSKSGKVVFYASGRPYVINRG